MNNPQNGDIFPEYTVSNPHSCIRLSTSFVSRFAPGAWAFSRATAFAAKVASQVVWWEERSGASGQALSSRVLWLCRRDSVNEGSGKRAKLELFTPAALLITSGVGAPCPATQE